MAQINWDLMRCQEQWGKSRYCNQCSTVHNQWLGAVDSGCVDKDFDFDLDIADEKAGYYCWCTEHKACVVQDGSGYQCEACDEAFKAKTEGRGRQIRTGAEGWPQGVTGRVHSGVRRQKIT